MCYHLAQLFACVRVDSTIVALAKVFRVVHKETIGTFVYRYLVEFAVIAFGIRCTRQH